MHTGNLWPLSSILMSIVISKFGNKYVRWFPSPLYLAEKLENENHKVKWGCNGISVHFSRCLDLQINQAWNEYSYLDNPTTLLNKSIEKWGSIRNHVWKGLSPDAFEAHIALNLWLPQTQARLHCTLQYLKPKCDNVKIS